jgi:dethiobiotin synthetase
VVARSGLGTINHTLLTLEALQTRWLRVAGVMMIGEPNGENRAAIEQYGRVPVIAEMPVLSPLDAATMAAWSAAHLDPQGRLLEFLR